MAVYGKETGDPRFTGKMSLFDQTLKFVHKRKEVMFKDKADLAGKTWSEILKIKGIK